MRQTRSSIPIVGLVLLKWLVGCDSGRSWLGSGPVENAAGDTGSAGAVAGGAGSSGEGTPDCRGLVTDTLPHPMTQLGKPDRFEASVDPEFGTRIVRVTDVQTETGGSAIVPMYSTIPAWNADESYLLLYEVSVGHRLYDGHSYEFVRRLDIEPADLEQVYWHPRDPDRLYFVRGNELTEYSVSQDTTTVRHTFADCESVSAGEDPMYISWDGASFGMLCEDTGRAFVYHLDTNTETASVPSSVLGAQVAPSGELVLLGGDVYDGDMHLVRSLDLNDPRLNASLGQLENGRDTLNAVAYDSGPRGSGTGTLVVFDLATGQDTVVVGQDTGYPYPPSGTHISAVAHRAPGWVAVSVVGDRQDGQELLDNELLLVDTNTSLVCRIGHHRSRGDDGPNGYFAAPHVVVSPSATRVVFGSDWGGGPTVDTYAVELPSFRQ